MYFCVFVIPVNVLLSSTSRIQLKYTSERHKERERERDFQVHAVVFRCQITNTLCNIIHHKTLVFSKGIFRETKKKKRTIASINYRDDRQWFFSINSKNEDTKEYIQMIEPIYFDSG